jgi:hypothetical protein
VENSNQHISQEEIKRELKEIKFYSIKMRFILLLVIKFVSMTRHALDVKEKFFFLNQNDFTEKMK